MVPSHRPFLYSTVIRGELCPFWGKATLGQIQQVELRSNITAIDQIRL